MREIYARYIVLFTGLLVFLLAMVFALIQNPESSIDRVTKPVQQTGIQDDKLLAQGRIVYQQQGCARCHAIDGTGNPRNPLDGIGNKYDFAEIRDRIIGAEKLRNKIPENILNLKQQYRSLPEQELQLLVNYLQSLH